MNGIACGAHCCPGQRVLRLVTGLTRRVHIHMQADSGFTTGIPTEQARWALVRQGDR